MSPKTILFAVTLSSLSLFASIGMPGQAENQTKTAHKDPFEKQVELRQLIEATIETSQIPSIVTDYRIALRDVHIPIAQDLKQGNIIGLRQPDPAKIKIYTQALTFLENVRKAGDEVNGIVHDNREDMMSDVTEMLARDLSSSDVEQIRQFLKLPLVVKMFDFIHSTTRLTTDFTYAEEKSLVEFMAWAREVTEHVKEVGDAEQFLKTSPPPQRADKATKMINDFVLLSHMDEIVDRTQSFTRDVYSEVAPMADEERETLKQKVEQFQTTYAFQKAMVMAMAPFFVAGSLNDDQINNIHTFIRSPVFVKLSDLILNAVRASTAYTKQDIADYNSALTDFQKHSGRSEEKANEVITNVGDGFSKLYKKWSVIIEGKMNPETVTALRGSIAELPNADMPTLNDDKDK